jgi:hypothetical protein
MDQIKRAFLKTVVKDIGLKNFYVAQAAPRDLTTGHCGKSRFSFQSDGISAGPDSLGEQVKDANRAAADVDGAPARTNHDVVQQPAREWQIASGLVEEPRLLA